MGPCPAGPGAAGLPTGLGDRGLGPDLFEEAGGEVAGLLVRSGLTALRLEELDRDPRALREAEDVDRADRRCADDARLRHLLGEAPDAAARPQLGPPRDRALGKDPDAGAGPQACDRRVEGAGVSGPALDRDLAHPVEDRGERPDLPQAGLRERADLPPLAAGGADRDRVPEAVVVAHDQQRAGGRDVLGAADRQPPPPADQGRADGHHEQVGAGDRLGIGCLHRGVESYRLASAGGRRIG